MFREFIVTQVPASDLDHPGTWHLCSSYDEAQEMASGFIKDGASTVWIAEVLKATTQYATWDHIQQLCIENAS